MTTTAAELVSSIQKTIDSTGAVTYKGLTIREWVAATILKGLLATNSLVGSDAANATLAVARADALLDKLELDGDMLVDPPAELRQGNDPQTGLTKAAFYGAHLLGAITTNATLSAALNPAAPAAPTANLAGDGAGLVTSGQHYYKMAYVSELGGVAELSSASSAVTTSAGDGKVDLSELAVSSIGGITLKNLYRTKAGGSTYYFLAQIANATTTYEDDIADASLTVAAPSTDTAWPGALAHDADDKLDALVTALGSTAGDPVNAFLVTISSAGAETRKGLTKHELFATLAEAGFMSDNTNLGAHTNGQLATHGDAAATALEAALNA